MITFIGKHTSKVDDKGRLVFPSSFKCALPEGSDMRFVIRKSLYSDCLDMYPWETWEKESGKIKDGLDFFNPAHAAFWREYMRDCVIVEPDPKFGRISIPRYLLDAIGINREATFSGINFKIEIWDKDKFEGSSMSKEEFIAAARSFSKEV